MGKLTIQSNPAVNELLNSYSSNVKKKLKFLRKLIVETAKETEGLDQLEETLKWGEPSYLAKKGSTIRIDWKKKKPDQYAIYFKCTSKLVVTFKEIYPDTFDYETTRAIVFKLAEDENTIPIKELKHCISMALNYHNVKHLPLLGAANI